MSNWETLAVRARFHAQLDDLRIELSGMGDFVAQALHQATQALLAGDGALAGRVVESDPELDAMAARVETHCFDIVARQQPVASDLRAIIGALRISASFERMGDLAEHIAKQALLRAPARGIPEELTPIFADMSQLGELIVARAIACIRTFDIDAVANVEALDSQVDALHKQVFVELADPSWEHDAATTADVTLLSRFYERYADHAVSVTRRVVNMVTGEAYTDVTLD